MQSLKKVFIVLALVCLMTINCEEISTQNNAQPTPDGDVRVLKTAADQDANALRFMQDVPCGAPCYIGQLDCIYHDQCISEICMCG
jgi:hypothetical protein